MLTLIMIVVVSAFIGVGLTLVKRIPGYTEHDLLEIAVIFAVSSFGAGMAMIGLLYLLGLI